MAHRRSPTPTPRRKRRASQSRAITTKSKIVVNSSTGGAKEEKPFAFELVPWDVLLEDAYVYYLGKQKYDCRNWERGYAYSLSFAALVRHLIAWWQYRQSRDPETGAHHLACVRFHAASLMRFEQDHPELDDRPIVTHQAVPIDRLYR
jgi:hypothetical protein